MKLVNLKITHDEALTLNNILIEEILSLVNVVNAQKSQGSALQAIKLMRTAQTGQQYLFDNAQKGETEFSENVCEFFRYLVSRFLENVRKDRDAAVEEENLDLVFQINDAVEKLEALLQKIPEKSLIVV